MRTKKELIKSIKIANFASFDRKGTTIENCAEVNFIYGENGTGKSSIGRFLSNPKGKEFYKCELEYAGESLDKILVFNREFIENNIKSPDGLKGVFTVGRNRIEDIEKADALRARLDELSEEKIRAGNAVKMWETDLENIEEQFRENAWDNIYKKYREDFPAAFKGISRKQKMAEKTLEVFQKLSGNPKNQAELKRKYDILFADDGEEILPNLPQFNVELARNICEIINNDVWKKVVVGASDLPFGKMIQADGSSDWVNAGRKYIKGDVCPFCRQRTVTPELIDMLESFFDGEYSADIALIKSLSSRLSGLLADMRNYCENLVSGIENIKTSTPDRGILTKAIELFKTKSERNIIMTEAKISEPSRKTELLSVREEMLAIKSWVDSVNAAIDEANLLRSRINAERKSIVADILDYCVSENQAFIMAYKSELKQMRLNSEKTKQALDAISSTIERLKEEVFEAEQKITSVRPTIDEMNKSLRNFGFTDFNVIPSDNPEYYRIMRADGEIVDSDLSDGESAFIAFLYFIQLCNGCTDIADSHAKKAVVLDDPTSSLDKKSAYTISVMIADLMKKISDGNSSVKQLFVLTHDIDFLMKLSDFASEKIQPFYWILRKNDGVSTAESFGENNPVRTEYQMLWEQLKAKKLPIIAIENIMRRILVYYASLTGEKLSKIAGDISFADPRKQLVGRRLLLPADFSAPGYIIDEEGEKEQYFEVFREIFTILNASAHYDNMMKTAR